MYVVVFQRGRHVGKIASKCKKFVDYVCKGLDKLGVKDLQVYTSDSSLEGGLAIKSKTYNTINTHIHTVHVSPISAVWK